MKLLFLDFSTRLGSVDDLTTQARGGMVTSLFRVTDVLSQIGHEVFVLADIAKDGMTAAGTVWCAADGSCYLKGYDWDFLILNRGIGEGYTGIKAKHRILWTHDLPHNGFISRPQMMNAFSATVFMSQYAEWIWRSFYHAIGKSFRIPNGIDRSIFYYDAGRKLKDRLIYASAPNRGLKRLPLIADAIQSRVKKDIVFEAYSNMAKMHPNEAAMEHDYASEYESVKKSSVKLHDPLPQSQFADRLRRASLMILPTDYPEICSNVILQSLACGTPVITTGDLGSAGEWIKHGKNGMLTNFQVHDYMIHTLEIVRHAVKVLENPRLHDRLIKGASKTKIFSWEQIGSKWDRMLRRLY